MDYQTPRGTYDILPDEVSKWHEVEEIIRKTCELYRYEEIRTPFFESTSVFAREGDSSDMVNKEMYTFNMGDGSFTLRPEGTAGVIRAFDQHKLYGSSELPAKYYYMGPMFRHEKPQKGRQRQFTQFGIEAIGAKSPEMDAETIALGVQIVRKMGISSVKVCINTLGDDASRKAYRDALKTYFEPYVDGLCEDCHRRYRQNPLRILDCKVDQDKDCIINAPKLADFLTEESKEYFGRVLKALDDLNIAYEIDERLVRGLDYYTDTVYEVISTNPNSGSQATVFGGGRYDNLVDYFGGPNMSGIGFGMGLERLIMLAQEEGHVFRPTRPLDVYVIGLGEVGSTPLVLAQQLRQSGYTAEINFVKRSLKSQFKSTDRLGAKYIIIIGEDECRNGTLNLKRTDEKTQVTIAMDQLIDQLKEWEK